MGVPSSKDSLLTAANAIDFLRPLGEAGLAVVIFGSFVVLLLVLRWVEEGGTDGKTDASQEVGATVFFFLTQ